MLVSHVCLGEEAEKLHREGIEEVSNRLMAFNISLLFCGRLLAFFAGRTEYRTVLTHYQLPESLSSELLRSIFFPVPDRFVTGLQQLLASLGGR